MAYVMSPALHFSAPRSSIALVKDPVGLRPGNQLRGVQPAASHGGRDVPPGERSADSPPTRPSVRCVAFALVIPGVRTAAARTRTIATTSSQPRLPRGVSGPLEDRLSCLRDLSDTSPGRRCACAPRLPRTCPPRTSSPPASRMRRGRRTQYSHRLSHPTALLHRGKSSAPCPIWLTNHPADICSRRVPPSLVQTVG